MVDAKIVAEYLISLSNPEDGEPMTHLKLQKLLYYSQGLHLAAHGAPLFAEEIYHWNHGPVVEILYHVYKHHGSGPIPLSPNADFTKLSEAQRELLNDVFNVYGQFSAWRLRELTHSEPPWQRTKDGEVIPHTLLREYFVTQLVS